MKFTLFAVLVSTAHAASRPQLSVQVRDGNFGLDELDPSLTWSTQTSAGDFDFEVGVDVAARPTSDLASLPGSAWGKVSKSLGGWGLKLRADVERDSLDCFGLELNADNDAIDLGFKLLADVGVGGGFGVIEASKGFGAIIVSPKMDVSNMDPSLLLAFDGDSTAVKVTASKSPCVSVSQQIISSTGLKVDASLNEQKITLSQKLNARNTLTPSYAIQSRKFTVDWQRNLGGKNSLKTTYTPNEDIDLIWKDDAWTANINMPVDGVKVEGVNVSVKRDVSF
ncbi:hypothetical protein TrVE_jg328 [Triparma verrucosa]|uniref:Uncharacterized protein n=1 Tax=Triparma verrucosa TaxID=1606542 RepID=A0A9W7BEV8_9STRA|nr:hypothetical protein TrVE_jg328 [Triparma verrucosa]